MLIIMAASIVCAVVYVWAFWHYQNTDPRALYHRVWLLTQAYFYDRSKLADWGLYEHKWESSIKTDQDAIEYTNRMLRTLGDPFTKLHSAKLTRRLADARDGYYVTTGMNLKRGHGGFIVRSMQPGCPSLAAGVRPGDLVMAVDALQLATLPAYKMADYIKERRGVKVTLHIKRNGKPLDIAVKPERLFVPTSKALRLPGGVAFERIDSFVRNNNDQIIERELTDLADCRALVLDLRSNSGGAVDQCLYVASMLIREGPLVKLVARTPQGGDETIDYRLTPDAIEIVKSIGGKVQSREKRERAKPICADKPIVVLVDQFSASSAEMLAGALRDVRHAPLIGERTLGKGLAQIPIYLPREIFLSITNGRYFTPSGVCPGDASDEVAVEQDSDLEAVSCKNPAARPYPVDSLALKKQGLEPDETIRTPMVVDYGVSNDVQLERALEILGKKP